jgi:hypothetical protein
MTDTNTETRAELLERLRTLLTRSGGGPLFPCVEDLVGNGPNLTRFQADGAIPNRQDMTQYLAAWGRSVGLDEETCRTWLTDYAVKVLSAISRSSPSAIRHSTKSNVRYIYRSETPFVCGRESNPCRARCEPHCPVYEAMAGKTLEAELARLKPRPEPAPLVQVLPVKVRYRQEFEASIEMIRVALAGGATIADILQRLQEQGMKTRTGRAWTEGILRREIHRLGSASEESSSSGHENPAEP